MAVGSLDPFWLLFGITYRRPNVPTAKLIGQIWGRRELTPLPTQSKMQSKLASLMPDAWEVTKTWSDESTRAMSGEPDTSVVAVKPTGDTDTAADTGSSNPRLALLFG